MIYNVGGGGANNAENVNYDNTDSGLEATNVQDGIDELNSNLTELKYTYSTSDFVKTGRKWIDGKDIYTKVISGTFSSQEIIIPMSDVDSLISTNGTIKNNIYRVSINSAQYHGNTLAQDAIRTFFNNDDLIINVGTSWINFEYKIIIECTLN